MIHGFLPILEISLLLWAVLPAASQTLPTPQIPARFFGVSGVNATFDYVVVGGGTAGLTIAERLAETANVSVAIIEAGGFYQVDAGNLTEIPAYDFLGVSGVSNKTKVDWGFVTQPQEGLGGREISYTQGKTLGGTSARNLLKYTRGPKSAYQKWADQVGDQSFTFDNLLPYFEKSATFTPPNYSKINLLPGDNITYDPSVFSSNGGPLQLSYSNYRQQISRGINSGMETLGLESVDGFCSGELLGFSTLLLTVDPADEIRSSSETSFLQSAVTNGADMKIYNNTLAKRIVFDSGKVAKGVIVNSLGGDYLLSATKEVIVSAGAFKSPQLLMISGIGPAATLEANGIPVISELSGVGQNLWDHVAIAPFVIYEANVTTTSALNDPRVAAQAYAEFRNNQSGLLTDDGIVVVGFQRIPEKYRSELSASAVADLAQFPADWPELYNFPSAYALLHTNDTRNLVEFNSGSMTPLSRGNVTINSTNADDFPLINPNWLSSTTDQEVAVIAIKVQRELAAASGVTVGPEISPGPSVQTDAEILDFVIKTSVTMSHPACTCAMGPASDPMAVVSTAGKVYGVQSLRVVDASIFPFLPPGYPQSTVYMLAEKIADDIKHGN